MSPTSVPLKEIFAEALRRADPVERSEYLAAACPDSNVRRRVEALLRASEDPASFLNPAAEPPLPAPADPSATAAHMPTLVGAVIAGRYKLLEQIGEGGMGEVWVAEQTEPVKRKVALKLIKAGMDSKSVLARFEAERQALAVMDHPNIAKVLDGGLVEAHGQPSVGVGRPFFVMEYVKGVPITEYCDATRLSVPERLNLFVQVCQAVQHAHQKGIIHRDLKPSNILVAPYDNKPVPKVIDFGLAKAMHQSLTERTLHTAHETVLGTPLYMSPEQAQLNNLDVDTRSDIYSLGVLLYELLTGTTPLEKQRFKEAAWDEIKRMIREEEPPRPSTRLSSSNTLAALAAGRQIEPTRLTKVVRGELDWIVMKALEKDRTRRYETANGFATDIERYLAGEPVLAVPPSTSYRLRKFARKHRAGLTTAAVIALVLVGGAAVSIWQAVRANVERDRAMAAEWQATTERENSRTALDFIQRNLLAWANPEREPDRDLKLRTAVDRAAQELEHQPADAPLADASIRLVLGETYLALGEYEVARRLLVQALATRRRELGAEHRDTIRAMTLVGVVYSKDLKRIEEAERILLEAQDLSRRIRGEEDLDTLQVMYELGSLYAWRGGSSHVRSALEDKRSVSQRRYTQAEDLLEKVLRVRRRTLGEEHVETLRTLSTLAHLNNLWALFLGEHERYARAEAITLRLQSFAERRLGPEHPITLEAMRGLAFSHHQQGRFDSAEPMYLDVLARCRRVLSDNNPITVAAKRALAWCYIDQGKYAEAEPLCVESLQLALDRPEVAGEQRFGDYGRLGYIRMTQKRWDEARKSFESALEANPSDHWTRFSVEGGLGECLVGLGKYAEAEPLLLKSYGGLKAQESLIPPAGKWRLTVALERLVHLYDECGKPDEAAKWHKKLAEAKTRRK